MSMFVLTTNSPQARIMSEEQFLLEARVMQEKVNSTAKIINDLKDEYIGVDGCSIKIDGGTKADDFHKAYFKTVLKEKSITKVLAQGEPLENAYKKFYFEQCQEPVKKGKLERALSVFKSEKLPEEDAKFFNNLKEISNYLKGGDVDNIEANIDAVLNHRLKYECELYYEDSDRIKDETLNSIKGEIMKTRYRHMLSEFIDYSKSHAGTTYMLQAIDNFIEGTTRIFSDFKIEASEMFKQGTFNFVYDKYKKILSNENLAEYGEVIGAFNNLHEKIFGTKQEMVKLDFSNGGCSYEIVNNKYARNNLMAE